MVTQTLRNDGKRLGNFEMADSAFFQPADILIPKKWLLQTKFYHNINQSCFSIDHMLLHMTRESWAVTSHLKPLSYACFGDEFRHGDISLPLVFISLLIIKFQAWKLPHRTPISTIYHHQDQFQIVFSSVKDRRKAEKSLSCSSALNTVYFVGDLSQVYMAFGFWFECLHLHSLTSVSPKRHISAWIPKANYDFHTLPFPLNIQGQTYIVFFAEYSLIPWSLLL